MEAMVYAIAYWLIDHIEGWIPLISVGTEG